jgi:hypothetical protein
MSFPATLPRKSVILSEAKNLDLLQTWRKSDRQNKILRFAQEDSEGLGMTGGAGCLQYLRGGTG